MTTPADILVAKLGKFVRLGQPEEDAIHALPMTILHVKPNRYLIREGDKVSRCHLLIDGYACRSKISRHGKRQIVSFHMPGDVLDLQHTLLPCADHNLQTVTNTTIGRIAVRDLSALIKEFPLIAQAFAMDVLIDASIFREWVLNVGTRDAKSRVAHMLCEFIARRQILGSDSAEQTELPFSQEQIGDATGLTAVHVNRTLRKISDEGAFTHTGRQYTIKDWPKLQNIAGFDPAYLHQMA
jgi:CRP-like cAMP-binding protein